MSVFENGGKCRDIYTKAFGEDSVCRLRIPDGFFFVEDDNGNSYYAPYDESFETFVDRLERSKKAGKNLFYEEWKEDAYDYPEDALF